MQISILMNPVLSSALAYFRGVLEKRCSSPETTDLQYAECFFSACLTYAWPTMGQTPQLGSLPPSSGSSPVHLPRPFINLWRCYAMSHGLGFILETDPGQVVGLAASDSIEIMYNNNGLVAINWLSAMVDNKQYQVMFDYTIGSQLWLTSAGTS